MANPSFLVEPTYFDALKTAGFSVVDAFYTDPRVIVWRTLPDRQNATLDLPLGRLHVKRYTTARPVKAERRGHNLVLRAGIPTADLVASGVMPDGRAVIVFRDLTGYAPADKLLDSGMPFDRLLAPTATLAARLHNAKLHHRDLYLCHFLIRTEPFDVRLIDTARVATLRNPMTRRRWIVKDLAQFWFSTTRHAITDAQRIQWLSAYTREMSRPDARLKISILEKVARIGRHDRRLNAQQPTRNVSIPT